jgi:hypothetical protein
MQRLLAVLLWHFVLPLTSLCAQRVIDLPATDRPLELRASPVYRVGGDLAPAWAQFINVDALAFDSAGRLFVLDRRGSRVVVLDPHGKLAFNLDGHGQGPGEFHAVTALAAFPDGSFVIRDPIRDAFIRYDANAKHLGDVRTSVEFGTPGAIAPVGRDQLVSLTQIFLLNGEPVADLANRFGPVNNVPLQRISLSNASARLIARAWLQPRPPRPGPRTPHGLAAQPHWIAALDGRVALADSITYSIDLFDANGRPTARLRRPFAPRPITSDFREWARRKEREKLLPEKGAPRVAVANVGGTAAAGLSRQDVEANLARMTFASHLQLIQHLQTDWAGRLWIERLPARPGGVAPIDLVTFDGRYLGTLGTVRMPMAFGPAGLIARVRKDAFESPVITVEKIEIVPPTTS